MTGDASQSNLLLKLRTPSLKALGSYNNSCQTKCAEMLEAGEAYLLEGRAFLRIFHFCLGILSVEFICSL